MSSRSLAGPKGLIIAIDGVIGAGKSTAAAGVAEALSYRHLDTGSMYRAVALAATRAAIAPTDTEPLRQLLRQLEIEVEPGGRVALGGEDVSSEIRDIETSRVVGSYADVSEVREALVRRQRRLGLEGGVVAEGRDMATVVFPAADLKIRMVANLAQRARRRLEEFLAKGVDITLDQVRRDIRVRDLADEVRDYGGSAAGVVEEVDTSGLSPQQVIDRLVDLARQCGA
ncbi:MAG: (d)CMP kinase [Candidatus Latescibacterota bacterium]|nr:(d)CMP kinase [Candidatus Latescibacterota bacterium]